MKLCPNCGSQLADDAKFCEECGQSLPADAPAEEPVAEPAAQAPVEAPAQPEKPVAVPAVVQDSPKAEPADMPVVTQMPPKKQLLSTFQYILLSLLYGLPVIGLIFLFIFGAGHPKNGSLKRFSAAMLILRLLFWIAVLALLIVGLVKNGRLLADAVGRLVPALEELLRAFCA